MSFLAALRTSRTVDWSRVTVFHMDEYVGLPAGHSASFPTFIRRHFIDHITTPVAFFPVIAEPGKLEANCADYATHLRTHPADLCVMGIGENGHIAFNDPPYAEFDDPQWVKVVRLDDLSRRQQVGEGHFANLAEVPTHAVTLTIPARSAADRILCVVPEARKAVAVQRALLGPVTETCPASVLRTIEYAHLYLDADSARTAFDRGE